MSLLINKTIILMYGIIELAIYFELLVIVNKIFPDFNQANLGTYNIDYVK